MHSQKEKGSFDIVMKRTAQKLNLPEYKVHSVVYCLFEYVHGLVENNTLQGFYFRFLGKFVIKPYKLKRIVDKYGNVNGKDINFKE